MSTELPNQLELESGEYLRKHRINELFEDLCSALCFQQPQDIKQFLIQQLEQKKKSFKSGLFDVSEIDQVFTLYDLRKQDFLDQATCKSALKTFASSQLQWSQVDDEQLPEKVSRQDFKQLVDKFFFSFKPEDHLSKHQGQKITQNQIGKQCQEAYQSKGLGENSCITKDELFAITTQILKNGGYPHINNNILTECIQDLGMKYQQEFSYPETSTFVSFSLRKVEQLE